MKRETRQFAEKLWPLSATQFFGVFNDNAFKMVAVLSVIGKSSDYSNDAIFLSFLTVVYVLPFLIFPVLAGYMADRFIKRNVMIVAKVAELLIMILGGYALYKFDAWGMWPLIGIMFFMAAQSAFFSPAFNAVLPEIFQERDISRANGIVGLLTFLAIITGVGGGVMIKGLSGDNLWYCGVVFSLFSSFGLIAVIRALPGKKPENFTLWGWGLFTKNHKGFKLIIQKRSILFSILGEAYFLAMGTALQALLLIFAKYSLNMTNDIDIGIIQLAPAFGIGIGCYMAGRLSASKVELGLVPYGAAGLSLFLLTTVVFPGAPVEISGHLIYPNVLISLLMLGVSGGIFVIPLRAYQQQMSDQETRGSLLANANVICFSTILFAGLLMLFLTGGDEAASGSGGGFLPFIKAYCYNFSPAPIFMGMAAFTLLVTICAFTLLPELAMRFAAVTLTHTLYKMRVIGRDNIPQKGGALIVANHVSFVDGLLLSASSSRVIRFLLHEDFYSHPLLHRLFKWLNFIEVPNPNKPKGVKDTIEKTREALRNGDLVCIFPEGQLTRNGVMGKFKKGYSLMIPEDMDIPIIPVHLGRVWGSIFTYYYGKLKFRLPKKVPYPVTVTIGKPVSGDIAPFALRQKISEIAADSAMLPEVGEKVVHSAFAKLAKRHPFGKTFFDSEGEGIANFAMLLRGMLLSCEIRRRTKERYVGILLPNSTHTAVATLAVMMADKVPAMLNFSVSDSTLDDCIAKAELDCIITSKMFIKKANITKRNEMYFLEDIAKGISTSQKIKYIMAGIVLPHRMLMRFLSPLTSMDVLGDAVILFSSGSSGSPKGVVLSHHNISSNVSSFMHVMGWEPSKDSLLGNLPLFHSFGMTTNFSLPMISGTKVVYLANPLDSVAVGKIISAHKLTVLLATPTFLQNYIRKCTSEQLSSVRFTIVGAERLRPELSKKFRDMTGRTILEGFGCTELSPVVSINIAESFLELGYKSGPSGSAGHPIPEVAVKVVNLDSGEDLPSGEEGLLLVKGPNVMQRYLKEPQKTAEVIKDGWYNTGDIAKIDAKGYIHITGRLSRFSKIAGEMVPHEVVEQVIADLLKLENRVIAVMGVPDDKKGEKLVVPYTEIPLSPEDIVKELRSKKIIPNLWIPKKENFIKVDEIPVLGSSKLDLPALKKIIDFYL